MTHLNARRLLAPATVDRSDAGAGDPDAHTHLLPSRRAATQATSQRPALTMSERDPQPADPSGTLLGDLDGSPLVGFVPHDPGVAALLVIGTGIRNEDR